MLFDANGRCFAGISQPILIAGREGERVARAPEVKGRDPMRKRCETTAARSVELASQVRRTSYMGDTTRRQARTTEQT